MFQATLKEQGMRVSVTMGGESSFDCGAARLRGSAEHLAPS